MMALESTLLLKGNPVKVLLDARGFSWQYGQTNNLQFVKASEIVSCWLCPKGERKCFPVPTADNNEVGRPSPSETTTLATDNKDTAILTQHQENEVETVSVAVATDNSSILYNNKNVSTILNNSEIKISNATQSEFTNTPSNLVDKESQVNNSSKTNIYNDNSSSDSITSHYNKSSNNEKLSINEIITDKLSNDRIYQTFGSGNNKTSSCRHTKSSEENSNFSLEYCYRAKGCQMPKLFKYSCCSNQTRRIVSDWKTEVLSFKCEDQASARAWMDCVWNVISALSERPRKLAIIINPVGGNRRGLQIYNQNVAPLLHRANIVTILNLTSATTQGEILGHQASTNPDVDGIVILGGDGSLKQVIHGMLLERAQNIDVDIADRAAMLPKTKLRLGIIPVGSLNCTNRSVHGSNDVTTAALHIVMGDRMNLDVGAVYYGNRQVSFATNHINFGILGKAAEAIHKMRRHTMIGADLRNVLSVFPAYRNIRSSSYSIKMLTSDKSLSTPFDTEICTVGCSVCSKNEESKPGQGIWVTVENEQLTVAFILVNGRKSLSIHGVSPAAHTGDGCCDALLVPKSSSWTNFKTLKRMLCDRDHLSTNDHITVQRCTTAVIKCPEEVPLAVDGELIYIDNCTIRMHHQKLQLFGRGLEYHETQAATK